MVGGPLRQPGVDFIPQSLIYEFGYWRLKLCLHISSLSLFAFATNWRKSKLTITKSKHTKTSVLQQATIQYSSHLFELKMITTGAALLEFWRGSDSCRCAAFQFWSLLHRVVRHLHLLLLLHLLPPLLETWPARVPAAPSAAATWTQMRFFIFKATTEAEFLDVIGIKVLWVFPPWYSQQPLPTDFTPRPPLIKSGLKLVCNVNIVNRNLKSENFHDYTLLTTAKSFCTAPFSFLSCGVHCSRLHEVAHEERLHLHDVSALLPVGLHHEGQLLPHLLIALLFARVVLNKLLEPAN